jgi:hypothetical protein
LQSRFFKGDPRLEACLVKDSAHILRPQTGDHVAMVHQAIVIFEGDVIDDGDVRSRTYGTSTANAVKEYKRKREIINKTYQKSADDIVGKMTIDRLDRDLLSREDDTPDFTGFTDEQIRIITADIENSRRKLTEVMRRLRIAARIAPSGGLLVTPRTLLYYDTKLKVMNLFRLNPFTADDFPIPDDIRARLLATFRGLTLPSAAGDPADALRFGMLLENCGRLQGAMNETFPKLFYPKATFKGDPLGFFAAFVDAANPSDPTVRFTRKYFDAQIVDADGRAVTLAHERAHTIFRANGHPGTGDNPFCVAPHLGDPNVATFDQAINNAYCYEWLIYALQPDYNPGRHRGPECGT